MQLLCPIKVGHSFVFWEESCMVDHERLVEAVLQSGAAKAQILAREKIVTDRAFWDICAGNGCGRFGKYWTCPPAIGEPETLMEELRGYRFGVLYQTIGEIEDSFDIEGMGEAGKVHKQTSRRVHRAMQELFGEEKFLHLSNGGCDLCEKCTKPENKPCRFPELTLRPMEGYCIDVYRTSKGTGLKYINGANTVTYFGLVLFGEEENA